MSKERPKDAERALLRLFRRVAKPLTVHDILTRYAISQQTVYAILAKAIQGHKLKRAKGDDGVWTYYDPNVYSITQSNIDHVQHPSTWSKHEPLDQYAYSQGRGESLFGT